MPDLEQLRQHAYTPSGEAPDAPDSFPRACPECHCFLPRGGWEWELVYEDDRRQTGVFSLPCRRCSTFVVCDRKGRVRR